MYARIQERDVFYTIAGQGPPCLVLHGGPGLDHTYLRPWLDGLAGPVQLIYYDQLGQGRSTRPPDFSTVGNASWVAEIEALRAYLGYERMILFGHSYGGLLAQDYALRHGDRLAGLILCDTIPVLDYVDLVIAHAQQHGTPEQAAAVVSGLAQPTGDDAEFRRLWMTILPLFFHNYDPQIGSRMDAATRYSGGAFECGFRRELPAFNSLPRLGEIATPTLVLAGRHDWIMPPAQGAERIHAALPDARLVVFDRSGHFPFIEEPEAFTTTVHRWLAGLPAWEG
ncbi:MAG TPA: alpha/beta fold hydrolase [Chloroflexia bacterium]|nr:alpha/beta fold hydrolase [Chloroflexia bacterium]